MLGGWGPTFVGGYPGAQTLYPTKLVSNLLLLMHRGMYLYHIGPIDYSVLLVISLRYGLETNSRQEHKEVEKHRTKQQKVGQKAKYTV